MSGAAKEADLVLAVLLYASRCCQEGDRHALRQMNFGTKEIEAITGLQMDDVIRAQRLGAHCLNIRLDRHAFWGLLSRLERLRDEERLQRELIARDAPFPMMAELTDMGGREYTRWRRLYGLPPGMGRPPEPDEKTENAVWRACEQRMGTGPRRPLAAEDYLAIAEVCDVPLRTVWQALKRWRQDASETAGSAQATLALGAGEAPPDAAGTSTGIADKA